MRTLESIARQDCPCEIFLIDDGSQPPITAPAELGPHRVHLLRLPENSGIAAALNHGMDAILAGDFDYIARHDAGDVDLDDRLSRQVAFLDERSEVALVGSSAQFHDSEAERFVFNAPTDRAAIERKMCYSPAFIHSTCMLRVSAMREMRRYSESFECAEDYELFLRMRRRYELANMPDVLVRAHYNVQGISLSKRRRSLSSRLRLQLRFFRASNLHSYLGLAQTLMLFVVPSGLVASAKRRVLKRRPAVEAST